MSVRPELTKIKETIVIDCLPPQPSKVARTLGGQSLRSDSVHCSPEGNTPYPVSVHDIIASQTDTSPPIVADVLVNTPACYEELTGYLSGNSPAPESYKAPLGWIKLKAWLDEQKETSVFSRERLLCNPEQYTDYLESTYPYQLLVNLSSALNTMPEYDTAGLVKRLENEGWSDTIANTLSVITDKLPGYDVAGLVKRLEGGGKWHIIVNNLTAIKDNLPNYDVTGLVKELEDRGQWHAIAYTLSEIMEKLPNYDATGVLVSMLASGVQPSETKIKSYRPYTPNITEILSRHRLVDNITKSHDLQTYLEAVEAIEKTFSGKPGYQPIIPNDIAEFRKLRLGNYSYDCFKLLFEPLKNNTNESKDLMDQLNELGIDTQNTELAINQAIGLVTKSIAGILEGNDSSENNRVLKTAYGSKLALHILRVKRGEWSLRQSEEEILDMMTDPDIIKSSRDPRVITTEVGLVNQSTRRSKLAPTNEATREAMALLRALRQINPETIANQTTRIRSTLQNELTNSLIQLRGKAEPGTNLAETLAPQIQKIEEKIKLLQEISFDPDNPYESLSQLAQFDTKNYEIIQEIRSALISSAIPVIVVPENIKDLQIIPDLGLHQLTPEQISSLGKFYNHHVIQEFWEKQGLVATSASGRGGSIATRTPSIKSWEDANRAIERSQQTSSRSLPVKFIANSSPFIRTIAGAMGDACYSQHNAEVPASADVITMTSQDMSKILGNFLLLESEYTKTSTNSPQKIKVLRAINPLSSTLKRYSAKDIMDKIINVSKQLLPEGYKLAVIIDDALSLATTNRPEIIDVLHAMKNNGEIKSSLSGVDKSVNFNGYDSTGNVYLV